MAHCYIVYCISPFSAELRVKCKIYIDRIYAKTVLFTTYRAAHTATISDTREIRLTSSAWKYNVL